MAQLTIDQAFQIAVQHHQAGQLSQAEQLYRQILGQQPNNADALHLLGVIAGQVGRSDDAVQLITRAIAVRPDFPEAYCNLGNILKDKGRFDEAIASYHRAIALNSGYADAHYNLGNLLMNKGLLDEAIASFQQAIARQSNFPLARYALGNALKANGQLEESIASFRAAIVQKPIYPQAYNHLGNVLRDNGQLDEAIAAYRQAIVQQSNHSEARNNLGNALKDKGQLEEAIASYRAAIAVKPDLPEAHCNLGNALQANGQLDDAIAAYRAAIALNPNLSEAHCNLGNALHAGLQVNEAIASYRAAIALKPDFSEAYCNLGTALQLVGNLDEALTVCRTAVALDPNSRDAHWSLALALLVRGELAQGWDEYEWRWNGKDAPSTPRNFPQPLWDGRSFAGSTLLLHAEQGFGDSIQFIRYLPLAAKRGGKIIVECYAEQRSLIADIAGECEIVVRGQPLPAFDIHCPLMSLARVFETTLENIPRHVPYLQADAAKTERWRQRMDDPSGSLKVGLAWAGSKAHKNDRNRSMSLAALAPLGRLKGIRFYSLQKGEKTDQTTELADGLELIDLTQDIKDFSDTAALIANLDLVISVDTSVAHLAGAMGKPVWVMLSFAPDWRWLLERADSPWYPTMRLFRQPWIGDWDSVVRRVVDVLADSGLVLGRMP